VRTHEIEYLRAAVLGDRFSSRRACDDEGREQLAKTEIRADQLICPRNYRLGVLRSRARQPLRIPDDLRAAFPIEP